MNLDGSTGHAFRYAVQSLPVRHLCALCDLGGNQILPGTRRAWKDGYFVAHSLPGTRRSVAYDLLPGWASIDVDLKVQKGHHLDERIAGL